MEYSERGWKHGPPQPGEREQEPKNKQIMEGGGEDGKAAMLDSEWGGEEDWKNMRGWENGAAAGGSAIETATAIAERSRQAYQAPCEGGQSRRRRRVLLRPETDKF